MIHPLHNFTIGLVSINASTVSSVKGLVQKSQLSASKIVENTKEIIKMCILHFKNLGLMMTFLLYIPNFN